MSDTPRTHLPIPHREHVGLTTYDAKDPDTSFPPSRLSAPERRAQRRGHDDRRRRLRGVQLSSAGRAGRRTPSGWPSSGLRFNRFHTTALCSPTRQALLTGRNHHAVGMGGITEIATSAPGYNSVRPDTAAPIAEILRLNGFSTAQFGKCHEVPVWETSPMGPFTQWPTGSGFEHFYGFVGGETNQWYPALYDGITPVEPPKTPEEGYHFTEDMTDRAITWVRQQKSLMPDKPFFMYFAPGATHAPHHVPTEWGDKYQGTIRRRLGCAATRDSGPPEATWGSFPPTPSCRPARPRSRPGTTSPTISSRCWPARWRCTPGFWSTPITTSAGSSTPSMS